MLREKNSKGQNNQDLNTRDSEIQTENVKLTQIRITRRVMIPVTFLDNIVTLRI